MKRKLRLSTCITLGCLIFALSHTAFAEYTDSATIQAVQEALNENGYDCGAADGVAGKRTAAAISDYQAAKGLTVSGTITEELLESMGLLEQSEGKAEASANVQAVPPIDTSEYTEEYDYEKLTDLMTGGPHGEKLKLTGVVDDIAGEYPLEMQKSFEELSLDVDGHYFIINYEDMDIGTYRLGDTLTVYGTGTGIFQIGVDLSLPVFTADFIETSDGSAPAAQSKAILDGKVLVVADGEYSISDVDLEHGWLNMVYAMGKGYGTPDLTLNLNTGLSFSGSEGAEVYLCDNGILQAEWRDPDTGKPVGTDEVFFYRASSGSPKTYPLYINYYDFDGNLKEERHVLDYIQSEEDRYFSEIYPKMQSIYSEFRAHIPSPEREAARMLQFTDENGAAVAYDANGKEIIRYPGTSASNLFAFWLEKSRIVSVTIMNEGITEVFQLN